MVLIAPSGSWPGHGGVAFVVPGPAAVCGEQAKVRSTAQRRGMIATPRRLAGVCTMSRVVRGTDEHASVWMR
jgi:hypothetical protein